MSKAKGGSKRVTFESTADGSIVERHIAPLQHDENVLDDVWIESHEWKRIRKSAAHMAETVCDGDHVWTASLDRGYVATMEKVFALCATTTQLSDALIDDLNFWTCVGVSRRGLEKYTLGGAQRRQRSKWRRRVIECVMYIQEECWGVEMDYDRSSQLICAASQKFSRLGRRFAFTVAAADEFAARNNCKAFPSSRMHGAIEDEPPTSETVYNTGAA